MFLRTAYNYDRDQASFDAGLSTGDDTPTIQSAKEECDINVIVERFGITGMMPQNLAPLTFGDFSNVGDYRTAMDALNSARDRFMELPSAVRARFGNSPQAFLQHCEERDDKGNRVHIDQLRKWGLAVDPPKEPEVRVVKVEVVNPPNAPKAG